MKIQIINVGAFGPQFENLTPNSIHDVLEETEAFGRPAYRVMGVGESVIVLGRECKVIEK